MVDGLVAGGDGGLAVGSEGCGSGGSAQGGEAGLLEAPGDTLCKVDAVAIIGDVTILFVVDHFGYAAHVETDAGRAACHRLDNGVGQVATRV